MRYVLFPGYVWAKDGDRHYITAPQLARLYGVDYRECRVVHIDRPESYRGYKKQPDEIELHPRSDGNYQLRKEHSHD